jgi:hypothetical protein
MYEENNDYGFSFVARVDYCDNEILRGICDAGWTDEDAEVVCREYYGEGSLSEAVTGLRFGSRTPIFDNVTCTGSESRLSQCSTSEFEEFSSECTNSSDRAAGVRCYQVCYDGSVRLAGGDNRAEGRVEVCSNNTWRTVCDVGWDASDAGPTCNSAGFYWGGEVVIPNVFGAGTGEILASNISCNGSEYDLYQCSNTTDIPDVCSHDRDAAVACQSGFIDMNIVIEERTEVVQENNVTLWCNAMTYSVANLTSYSWRNSQGVVVADGTRVNISLLNASYSNYYGAFIFNSSLSFSPLWPSDGDRYECELTLSLPRVGVNISNTTTTDLRVRVLPLPVEVNSTIPFVDSPLTINCTAEYPPGVPQSLTLLPRAGSPALEITTVNEGPTSRTIEGVLESVDLNGTLQYICIAEVDGEYAYTQRNVSNRVILLTPILPPRFIQEPVDVSLVTNSSRIRSGGSVGLDTTFSCTVQSQPLTPIEWSYTNLNGEDAIDDLRISIENDPSLQLRQVESVLTLSSAQFEDQGVFGCSATSPFGSLYSSAYLNIFVLPEVSVESESGTELVEGEEISLSCTVNGSWPAPTQVQWQRDGVPFLSSTDRITITTSPPSTDSFGLLVQTSSLVISDTHPQEDSGMYTCKAFLTSPGVPTIAADLSVTVQGKLCFSISVFKQALAAKNIHCYVRTSMG